MLANDGLSQGGWVPPATFDDYRMVRKLGSGASGEVYLAHDQLLDRAVSVKFLKAPGEESLAQFLLEARAAARIQHPNVAAIYRVGKVGDRPYLVSEYARGRPLDRLPKPLDWNAALSYALDLSRGLSAAHRCGVLHRDLKPANAVLTESGEVKLVDFGLAMLLAPEVPLPPQDPDMTPLPSVEANARNYAGVVVGTPYYMAPELWRGEPATVRSDLYALGATLYELCAGRPPAFDLSTGAPLPLALQRENLPSLLQSSPSVKPAFADIVDRCLRRDPGERFAAADEVLDALEVLAARGPGGPPPEGNPYRGLQPFEAEHRALFFGRRRAVLEVLDRLRGEPFLALTGDSGVGKSSLCLAGVLPAVAEGQLVDKRSWQVARMVPGRLPCDALAAALAPALVGVSEVVLESLAREEAQAFVRRVRGALPPDRCVLLYIDQMEELVTVSAPEQAAQVALALEPFAAGVGGLKLLGSTRSDFLTRLAALPGLGAHLPRAVHLVRSLTVEELREAVQAPARMTGVRFESEALVNDLVASAERAEGGLPLLQFALAELWEARDARTQVITERSVAAIGGVGGALARHAESVLRALLPEQRAAARAVLLRLVTAVGTRARRSEGELLAVHPSAKAALEALVRGRLVVAREAEGAATYEVAHEAILTGCATVAGWLGEEAETKAARERLSLAAVEWERRGRDRELLWGARSLEEASEVKAEGLTPSELEFLETSRRAVSRRRQRGRVAAAAAVLLLATTGVVVQAVLSRQRERAIGEQRQRSQAALAQARARVEALARQRSEAYRLFDEGDDAAEKAWGGVRAVEREADRLYGEATAAMESAVAIGGDALRHDLGQVFLERSMLAEDTHRSEARDLFLEQMRLNDAGGDLERAWIQPASVTIAGPRGKAIRAARYERNPDGSFATVPLPLAEVAPATLVLAPGSYLLSVGGTLYPIWLRRGEARTVTVPDSPVPKGFVFVPGGAFLFGSADEDAVRVYLATVPIHAVEVGPFSIAQRETTYADWIRYLEQLPPAELRQRLPRVSGSSMLGTVRLIPPRDAGEKWVFEFQGGGAGKPQRVKEGEELTFPGRDRRVSQDWRLFPVSGISFEDAQAYARWLGERGGVPGARLCTEHEWMRAARGADDRKYPHGNRLLPDDANFDETYGKKPDGFGPDVVGSHPASRSPFGVEDMSGNIYEWTESSIGPPGPVTKGGGYYEPFFGAGIENRQQPERTLRDPTIGARICASVPPSPRSQP